MGAPDTGIFLLLCKISTVIYVVFKLKLTLLNFMAKHLRRRSTYRQQWASAILVRTSAILQYCGQAIWLRNCGLKKVAELRLQTFKI